KRRRLPTTDRAQEEPAGAPPAASDQGALLQGAATGSRSISKSWLLVSMLVFGAGAMALVGGLGFGVLTGGSFHAPSGGGSVNSTAATFVGSETCAGCHRAQVALWRSSHHKRAMAHATDKSVLGDFKDASFAYNGVRSRFFRK